MNGGEEGGATRNEGGLRLGPGLASFRLIVLAFVRDYIGKHHQSPSLGEIANGLSPPTNRKRVLKAVKSLARDGLLLRRTGPRGIALPTERDAALRVLRELGWRVDQDLQAAYPPDRAVGVTDPPLLPPAELDYLLEQDALDQAGGEEDHDGDSTD